ncbi:MAG: 3D domain-containing protein [Bacillota bacterium]|nr:3D domain-containing protein [Bacillota bacterium]
MYLLPITTYFDYWRATRTWGSYLGGLAVFAVGTRYSTLTVPEKTPTTQSSVQVSKQSLISKSLGLDEGFSESRQRAIIKSRRGVLSSGEVSRGLDSQGPTSQEVLSQVLNYQGAGANQGAEVSKEAIESHEANTTVTSNITIEDNDIPFEIQYIESDELPPGNSKLKTKGEKGIYRRVVKTFEVDGKPVDQQVQSSFELISPKKEVILQNSKLVPKKKVIIERPESTDNVASDSNKLDIARTLTVESTAYTYTGNKTATGVEPRKGIIAVDPKVIAMGSKVYVEGYGYAIAADTGGDIRGNRIDVFFTSLRQCIDWGRKSVHVYVLSPK